jgi:uncharacterized protein (UPF0332 family)
MTKLAASLWNRATEALAAARHVLGVSPDAAASRAYCAAFYAVSALFAFQGKRFRKHSALEAAVHRDLVRPGVWPAELGQRFSDLVAARQAGDYGEDVGVTKAEAIRSVAAAEDILQAVARAHPEAFPPVPERGPDST